MNNNILKPYHYLLSWCGLRLNKNQIHWVTANIRDYKDWCDLRDVFQSSKAVSRAQDIGKDPNQIIRTHDDLLTRGDHLVALGSPHYPKKLELLERPPLLLTVRGHLPQDIFYLGVVGSRSPSLNTLTWINEELSKVMSLNEVVSLSGGAMGVDQACHLESLKKDRPTIVMLPTGINCFYPTNLKKIEPKILETGGAIVSIFSPNLGIQRQNFHYRNEIIARLSNYLLVVEAKRRSGTMVTAGFAQKMECGLGVLPCSPFENGRGGLDLLRDGGDIICDSEDLIIAMGHSGSHKSL